MPKEEAQDLANKVRVVMKDKEGEPSTEYNETMDLLKLLEDKRILTKDEIRAIGDKAWLKHDRTMYPDFKKEDYDLAVEVIEKLEKEALTNTIAKKVLDKIQII